MTLERVGPKFFWAGPKNIHPWGGFWRNFKPELGVGLFITTPGKGGVFNGCSSTGGEDFPATEDEHNSCLR